MQWKLSFSYPRYLQNQVWLVTFLLWASASNHSGEQAAAAAAAFEKP